MKLSSEEVTLLRELREAGSTGRTISGNKPRTGLSWLVEVGYVNARTVSVDAVFYEITSSGVEALTAAERASGRNEN
jgi:hypothetical protein